MEKRVLALLYGKKAGMYALKFVFTIIIFEALYLLRDFSQAGVRRTNFDKKMPIDKHFVCRRADSHRFGATHPLISQILKIKLGQMYSPFRLVRLRKILYNLGRE